MCGNVFKPSSPSFLGGPIGQTALSIGGGLLLGPEIGALTGGIGGASAGTVGGALAGAGIGGLENIGHGVGGVLKGAATGGIGGGLSGGGASDLFGGTALGNTLGLSTPEGGSAFSNLLGSSASAPNTIGSLLTGSGSGASNGGGMFSSLFGGSGASGLSSADNSFLNSATNASNGFSPGESNFLSNAGHAAGISGSGTLAAAMPAATGGGGSSYGSLGTIGSLLGAANSLNANDKAQKDLLSAQTNSMNALQPFLQSGTASNAKLSDLLGTGTNTGSADFGSLTKPFNPSDLQNDPGYQFQLQQGDQALNRRLAAAGGLNSGAAIKAGEEFGQGLAGTTYGNAFARDQATKQQQYGMFAGQAGQGQSAANAAGNIYGQTGTAQAGANISSANILNQSLSSLLNGSGAKKPVNIGGQIVYI